MTPIVIFVVAALGAVAISRRLSSPSSVKAVTSKTDAMIESEVRRQIASATPYVTSPISGVSDAGWRAFVEWSKQGRGGTVTAAGNMGAFLLNARQLMDVGLMRGVRRVALSSGREVYDGEWMPPHSRDEFLSDPALQYEAFSKVMRNVAREILSRYRSQLGRPLRLKSDDPTLPVKDYELKPVTLSGLLGAAKQSGMYGLEHWIASPKDRDEFQRTTTAFIETNGMF